MRTLLLLCLIALAGCADNEGYPPGLTYPPREDPLVLRPPAVEQDRPEPPGELDRSIAALAELGAELLAPSEVDRDGLDEALEAMFGRPGVPTVTGDADIDGMATALGLTPDNLVEGGKLYRRLCLHCHGLSGDGRGPTGAWIQPHPRDFRPGTYKFASTEPGEPRKLTREDLKRLIRDGLPGSSMPPFKLLPEPAFERLSEYVIHLSVRGEAEYETLRASAEAAKFGLEVDVVWEARHAARSALNRWLLAGSAEMKPTDQPPALIGDARFRDERFDSVRRGYRLFTAADGAGCIKCHADFGRQATYRYDAWGTLVRPRNLTEDVYRGGKEPIALYHRLRGGIGPSGMPSFAGLGEQSLWDLVHFVEALPFPQRLPPEVRSKIYPE